MILNEDYLLKHGYIETDGKDGNINKNQDTSRVSRNAGTEILKDN